MSGFLSWYWNLFTQRTIIWILHNIHPDPPGIILSFQSIWGTEPEPLYYKLTGKPCILWDDEIKTTFSEWRLFLNLSNDDAIAGNDNLKDDEDFCVNNISDGVRPDPTTDRENIKIVSEFLLFADLSEETLSHCMIARPGVVIEC